MTTPLHFLDFEHSDDDAGVGVFDAMASVRPDQLAALQAEIVAVLAWAHAEFGPALPLDEDGEWDYDLTSVTESSRTEFLAFDPAGRRLVALPGQPPPAGLPRHVVSLSITGSPAFSEALKAAFVPAE